MYIWQAHVYASNKIKQIMMIKNGMLFTIEKKKI